MADSTLTRPPRATADRRARRSVSLPASWRPTTTAVAAVTLGLIVAYAVLVPVFAPDSLTTPQLVDARQSPSPAHPFGTDHSGLDLFVRVAQALRVSLFIAVVCAIGSTVIGVAVGTVAATVGGWVDAVLMRFSDTLNALPHLLLGVVIVAMYRGSLIAIILSIALIHWSAVARIVRSEALTVRSMEYVDATYLSGASRWHVLRRHILPATLGQAAVAVVLLLPHAIWHESTLSFLGLGLPPDQASLGTLLQVSSGEVLLGSWWTLAFPALFLVVTTLAVSGVAGALRDRFAPQAASTVVEQ